MSLKEFLQKQRPDELTETQVALEIRRLEKAAGDMEYHHYNSEPHLEAVALMRADAEGLKKIQARLLAGQKGLPPFEPQRYDHGAIVQHRGAIWQAKKSTGQRPGDGTDWQVIDGTPTPMPPALPAVIDTGDNLTDGFDAKTEDDRYWLSVLEEAEKDYRQHIKTAGLTEADLTRPPSLRRSLIEQAVHNVAVARKFERQAEEIKSFTKRLEALEEGGIQYRGIYQRAQNYSKGDVTTFHGSAWIALRSLKETEEPGTCDGWMLMVKKGRDA
ncbi:MULTISPECIES: hypothetical protein [Brucella/Ochrobactrum group]|uniref:hypothetical protein n=1 Tax=Brucella/Ochrobactrum group TaxID=2826938 RepID=UPI001E47A917|nr:MULTISPECIES: hypothetical protein [Brucella/Ochrobactrum group]MCQ9144569.1 hypothetical protein [Ochrobactrum sp. BTU2]UGQ21433.1 hypothetical protein LRL11_01455 [Brucella anthropi]